VVGAVLLMSRREFLKLFYLPMRSEGFEKPRQVVSHRERHLEVAFC
jgi:hypothetical protein